jgi:uncharacterized membrane protein
MKKTKKILFTIWKELILFCFGGLLYMGIEMLYRGHTHPTMFLLGGLCFVLVGEINEIYPWDMPLVSQMLISAVIITILEFIFGMVLNVWLGLGIWDYSNQPYNLCGQICLIFSICWFFLSALGIFIDDFLRWKLFRGQKPHYHIFYSHCEKLH